MPWDQPRVKAQVCVHRSRPAELSLHGPGHFGSRANIASRNQARLLLSPASFRKRAESVLIREESATGSDEWCVIRIPENNICRLDDRSRHRAVPYLVWGSFTYV